MKIKDMMFRALAVGMMAAAMTLPLTDQVFAASETYVVDNAALLTNTEFEEIEELAAQLSEKYSANIVILTENTLGETSQDALQKAGSNTEINVENAYVAEYYDEFYGVNEAGVICYVNMSDRLVDLDSTGSIEKLFDYERLSDIREDMTYFLSSGNYAQGFRSYLAGVDEGFKSEGAVRRMFRIFSAVGAAIVSAIAVSVSKSKLNTARKQTQANRYQKPGSMQLTRQQDIYMYSTMNRVKRATERERTGGGGGGSFHSSGGGSHTSSSGHF